MSRTARGENRVTVRPRATASRSCPGQTPSRTTISARNAGVAERDSFFDYGHRERRRAGFRERSGDLHGAVAVSVRLDYRNDARTKRRGIRRTNESIQSPVVPHEGADVDFSPRGPAIERGLSGSLHRDGQCCPRQYPREDQGSCQRFANLVYCLMNATLSVPVGPFLCFPMMISAMPLFSSVALNISSR